MDKPNIDLLDLLISLYAEQEGIKIKYERCDSYQKRTKADCGTA